MRLPTKTLTTVVVTWLLDLLRARRSHQKYSRFNLSVGDIRSARGFFSRSAPSLPANFSLGLSLDLSPGRLSAAADHRPTAGLLLNEYVERVRGVPRNRVDKIAAGLANDRCKRSWGRSVNYWFAHTFGSPVSNK